MFPDSPYAVPVPSFRTPVPLVTVDPQAEPLAYIGINCAWFPVIAGSLKQLLLQTTWATDDPAALNLVQERVFDLIALFNCATAKNLTQICGVPGSGCEDCMGCCIRVNNGILQTLDCGVWTDVPGQPQGGIFNPSQPGAGSPQPAPGGGCAEYHFSLPGNGTRLLPTVVSTGDTILISGASGVSYDGRLLKWFCPDGSQFIAGACTSFNYTDAGNPVPGSNEMRLVAEIGGTFYDVFGTMFTVPAGHTNDPVVFQLNSADISIDGGSIDFDATVCNNQAAGTWSSLYDFAGGELGWSPYTCAGDCGDACNAGVGSTFSTNLWHDVVFGCSSQVVNVIQSPSFDLSGISSIDVTTDNDGDITGTSVGSGLYAIYHDAGGWHPILPGETVLGGVHTTSFPLNRSGVDAFRVSMSDYTGTWATRIQKILIHGTGSKPPQLL